MTPGGYVPVPQLAARVAAHRAEEGERARVAFVLAPGGAAGAYQAGALQALAEHGVRPDLVIGTSSGALNGLGLVLDALAPPLPGAWPRTRLGRIWRQMSRPEVGARLVVDKPALLGWLGGRSGCQDLAYELLAQVPHLGAAWQQVQAGLFAPAPLRALLTAAIARALGEPGATPDAAGHLLVDAWAAAAAADAPPPALLVLATDVQSHQAVPFVLGDVALAERLFHRRHPVRALGHGSLTGAAVVDALLASAAIPGAFPAVALPAARTGSPPRRYVDGAIAASEPFHLAIDAGATLIVSLEVAPYARPPRSEHGPERHPLATAADALMAIQERYLRADARGVAQWNLRAAEPDGPGHRRVLLYRLAPSRQGIGLLEFDGRHERGERVMSLRDWYMEGYGDAGGGADDAWADYVRGRERFGDRGTAIDGSRAPGFWEATERPAPGPHGPLVAELDARAAKA